MTRAQRGTGGVLVNFTTGDAAPALAGTSPAAAARSFLAQLEEVLPGISARWNPAANARREEQSRRLDRFVQRATIEGILRADLPTGWARLMLDRLVDSAAHDFAGIEAPQAADLVVDTLLNGIRQP